MPVETALDTLYQQLQTLIAYFQRPVVQWQVGGLLAAILLAFITARLANHLLQRVSPMPAPTSDEKPSRRLRALRYAMFPALAVVFIQLVQMLLTQQIGTIGLIANAQLVFWLYLGYLMVISLLYIAFGEEYVRPYHRRLLLPLFVLVIAFSILGSIFDLRALGSIELVTLFRTPITVNRLAFFSVVLYLSLSLSGFTQDILRDIALPRFEVDKGTSNAILTITRYVVLSLGFVFSLGALGLDLSTLAIIGGGLSIGIGFGLQQIVANFISGILLLFEQSLRPGDMVEVGGELARVENLSIRSTVVRTMENVDVVIPNETLLTTSVKNYSTTSPIVRCDISVGVSYNSDPTQVRGILKETVNKHGNVLSNPEPKILFQEFGDSSLNFWILFWVNDVTQRFIIASDLRMMIWKAFEKHEIEIPFPQRDLHFRGELPLAGQVAMSAPESSDKQDEDDDEPATEAEDTDDTDASDASDDAKENENHSKEAASQPEDEQS